MLGLAHAMLARQAGYAVTVFDRHARPLGASVRNFGTIWPIGCVPGAEREQALFGLQMWREIAAKSGIWHNPCGSLSLAYRDSSWQVLQEFAAANGAAAGYSLLDKADVLHRFPAVNPDGLRGALRSPDELVLHTPTAIPALIEYIRSLGVDFHFATPVVAVRDNHVETNDGTRHAFDHLVIAAGEEMRMFFPRALAAAGIQPCRLQMMRTVPQPAGFDLGAIITGDLTLCHYPAFATCPSIGTLQDELAGELPDHKRWGVHVIVAQHHDGSITLGDSHEYGEDLDPASHVQVDELILSSMAGMVRLPDPTIATRWQGTYLKSTRGITQVVIQPRDNVTMITAMGGLGMTLGWARARATIDSWLSRGT